MIAHPAPTAIAHSTAASTAAALTGATKRTTTATTSSAGSAARATAVLGDKESAFIGPTGPDTVAGALDHFARCPNGADQYMVSFIDGHAATIARQYCKALPSSNERVTEARRFFPDDAPPTGSAFTTEVGYQAWSFTSHQLSTLFKPADFQSCQDGIPAGTFELDITPSGWQLGIGKCP